MGSLNVGSGSNGEQTFRLGLIDANPVVVVIATSNLDDQSRYTTQALGNPTVNGNVSWLGTFSAPSGIRSNNFAGPAVYRNVMAGRYQYVLHAPGRPIVVMLHVGSLNLGLVPPTGNLRLLP